VTFTCSVRGQPVEVVLYETIRIPEDLRPPDPEALCAHYLPFLERVDTFIEAELGYRPKLFRAEQTTLGRWLFFYPDLDLPVVVVTRGDFYEEEVGRGMGRFTFSDQRLIEIWPK